MTEAQASADALGRALSEIANAIALATARSLVGLLVKARYAQRDIDLDSDVDVLLNEGLIRDLLAMGGIA